MGRVRRGCGCAVAVLLAAAISAGFVGWKYVYPWWKKQPPPASGGELVVRILDVGPVNGDSILISSPAGKTVLIDAGDTTKGKAVVEALKRHNVQQIDYFIVTHPHPDHMGGAGEVFKAFKVLNVIDNGQEPSVPPELAPPKPAAGTKSSTGATKKPPSRQPPSITRFYDDYKAGLASSGANHGVSQPGTKYDLGGGALLTILAPSEPFFTKEQMKGGGNEPNANSIVARLDYGSFSMLLAGDAEDQTEHRLLTKDLNLEGQVLKVSHHGSKYASSNDFLKRVKPEIAIISCGAWNRYGHPAQSVLDRLRAANPSIKLYRTDLHGEITLTSRGKQGDVAVKTAKEATEDLWVGRMAQKDDSSRSGFIAYGDFGPPPRPRRNEQKSEQK
ncbi:MAG TPA: ComEC/Rec2 family competence protein [Pyrinomonadaceae bacterium]|nr:ComEC/Rec2 family competence protein [Pyrinomonadaceae bacterium]